MLNRTGRLIKTETSIQKGSKNVQNFYDEDFPIPDHYSA